MKIRQSGLTWQVVDDEVVVLDLDGSVYLRLNGSGRLLWERLESSASMAELADALVDRYGIDNDQASADAGAFIDALRSKQLIEE